MAKQTAHEEWMGSQWLLKEAERAAGIEKALEELNERGAYITKTRRHFDDERKIVFAIPDLAL